MATFAFTYLVKDRLVWRDKTVPQPWIYGERDTRAFYVFRSF